MAQLANVDNVEPMIDVLGNLINAAGDARNGYKRAARVKQEMESNADKGATLAEADQDNVVEQYVGVIDVATIKAAYDEAVRIFTSVAETTVGE